MTVSLFLPLARESQKVWVDFLNKRLQLTMKLLHQGFLVAKLKSSLRKFYDRHHDLVKWSFEDTKRLIRSPKSLLVTEYMRQKLPWLSSVCRNCNPVLYSFMTCQSVCDKSNTVGVTSEAGTAYCSVVPKFTHGVSGVRVARWLLFCEVFSRSCFVSFLLSFGYCIVCRLSSIFRSDYPCGIVKLFITWH